MNINSNVSYRDETYAVLSAFEQRSVCKYAKRKKSLEKRFSSMQKINGEKEGSKRVWKFALEGNRGVLLEQIHFFYSPIIDLYVSVDDFPLT